MSMNPVNTTPEHNSYVIVMRASSGVYFGKNDPLPTMRFPTEIGPVEITIYTHRIQLAGFTNPVRRGLVADVRGVATSMTKAVEVFANFTRGIAAVLSVAANAPIGHFTADIVFETTPGKREREYLRRSFPEDPGIPSPGRRIKSADVLALLAAWMDMRPIRRLERWSRSAIQYHHALQEWEPGAEIPAMNHLWTGMEALTPIALEHHLKSTELTRDQLLEKWKTKSKELNAEVRRRILFDGDDLTYGVARDARNQALHGFEPTWKVRDGALAARDKTASYLRASLIRLASLEPDAAAILLAFPYHHPFHWTYSAQMFGRVIGDIENSARIEDFYPRVDWIPVEIELPPDTEGDAMTTLVFAVNPYLDEQSEFKLDGVHLLTPVLISEEEETVSK